MTASPLVPSPVFLLSPPRSGSTLLRCILDTHSQIRAPHELHLRHMRVHVDRESAQLAAAALGHQEAELTGMFWDRLLHNELVRSGKRIIVEKSPCNLGVFDELRATWSGARFLLMFRNHGQIAASMMASFPEHDKAQPLRRLRVIGGQIAHIRDALPELVPIRYEDLARDPANVVAGICASLGVPFESGMLDYGGQDHGPMRYGLGDWGERILTGRIQKSHEYPDAPRDGEITAMCAMWGY